VRSVDGVPVVAPQASLEYGGSAVQSLLRWAGHSAQEYWYWLVGGVILLIVLWQYAKK